ncbi:hypothetical protein CBR_g12238 [Chara braunii]|uniref:Uncharacterized protein n=1 Tax=Chara braunii TaxID=69332 RepID=A0A388KRK0_CHABU|nr:hypothetical protein CBR_g12238 [Chara braunii]|eukprot:GBG72666.1 hypothetical protein CBR_g12238 [Chara braunii]
MCSHPPCFPRYTHLVFGFTVNGSLLPSAQGSGHRFYSEWQLYIVTNENDESSFVGCGYHRPASQSVWTNILLSCIAFSELVWTHQRERTSLVRRCSAASMCSSCWILPASVKTTWLGALRIFSLLSLLHPPSTVMAEVVASEAGGGRRMGSFGGDREKVRGADMDIFPGGIESRGFISPSGAPARTSSVPISPPPPPSGSQIPGDDQSLRPRKFRGFELRFHPAEKVFPQVLDIANPFQVCSKLPEIPIYVSNSASMIYQGVEYTAITYSLYYVENPSPAFGGLFPRNVGYHEGDVEKLTILYSKDPYREWEPCHVYFFAHGSGQGIWLPWGECQHTDDNYLIVYVAKNSHASYYLPGTYVRIFGVANDHCSERGKHLRVSAYLKAFDHQVNKGVHLSASAAIPPQRSVKPWERFAWPIVSKKVRRDIAKPPRTGPGAAAAAAAALGIPSQEKDHKLGSSCDQPVGLFCGCASLPTPGRQKSKKTQALQVQFSLTYPEQVTNAKARPSIVNRGPIYVFEEERKPGERTQPMQVPGPTFEERTQPMQVPGPTFEDEAATPGTPRLGSRVPIPERHVQTQPSEAAETSGGQSELTGNASREAGQPVKSDAVTSKAGKRHEIASVGGHTSAAQLPSRVQGSPGRAKLSEQSGRSDGSAAQSDAVDKVLRVERVAVKSVVVKSRLGNQASSLKEMDAAADSPPSPVQGNHYVVEPDQDLRVTVPDASSAVSSPSRVSNANLATKDSSASSQPASTAFLPSLDSDNDQELLDCPELLPDGITDGVLSPRRATKPVRSQPSSPQSKRTVHTVPAVRKSKS